MGPGAALSGRNAAQLRQAIAALNGAGAAPAGRSAAAGREMVQLVQQMQAGQVQLLLIDAPNPAYTLPGGLDFAGAMRPLWISSIISLRVPRVSPSRFLILSPIKVAADKGLW